MYLFSAELEQALRADQAAIRRDGVATLARIMRQEGPPSDRALATLWLYHLANHDPDTQVRAMAAVPIRLTAVWSESLEEKLYAPEFEVRLDAVYTLGAILDQGSEFHADVAYRWLDGMADTDPHQTVRETASKLIGRSPVTRSSPKSVTPFLKRRVNIGATQHDMMTALIAYTVLGLLFITFVFGQTLFGTGVIGVAPIGLGGMYCLFALSGIWDKKIAMQLSLTGKMHTFYGSAAYTMGVMFQIQGVLLISIGLAILLLWSDTFGVIMVLAALFVVGCGILAVHITAWIIRRKQRKLTQMKTHHNAMPQTIHDQPLEAVR